MRVYVPIYSGASNVAELVLYAEGVEYETGLVDGDLDYSLFIADIWARGEGFVLVEHDVAPWVGALDQLAACSGDWCMFRYAKGGGLSRGLGCTKFSSRLVREYPDLADEWRATHWLMIDGTVGSPVAAVLRAEDPERMLPCYHTPSVAHARGPD
jgi:hypothetical protein